MTDDPFARLSLSGRSVLVTGGASGIGAATAELFAARGADIVILDRDRDALAKVAARVADPSRTVLAYPVDVTIEADVCDAIADARRQLGSIDILVNNAGTGARTPSVDLDTEKWAQVLDINLTSAFVCSREVARSVDPERGGAIVNVASIMGLTGNPIYPNLAYHASKGGLINMTRALATEWAPRNIRVNAVAPTFVETPLTENLLSQGDMRAKILDRTPLKRLASAGDVAEAIAFLASDAAAMITGVTLPVDGGWLAA